MFVKTVMRRFLPIHVCQTFATLIDLIDKFDINSTERRDKVDAGAGHDRGLEDHVPPLSCC
jgi:hypothetical protein